MLSCGFARLKLRNDDARCSGSGCIGRHVKGLTVSLPPGSGERYWRFHQCRNGRVFCRTVSPPCGFLLRLSAIRETMIHSWYVERTFVDPLSFARHRPRGHLPVGGGDERIDFRHQTSSPQSTQRPFRPAQIERTRISRPQFGQKKKSAPGDPVLPSQLQIRCVPTHQHHERDAAPQDNRITLRNLFVRLNRFSGDAIKGPYFGTRLSPKRLVMRPTSAPIITPPESGCQQNAAMKASVADAAGRDASPSGTTPDTDAPI